MPELLKITWSNDWTWNTFSSYCLSLPTRIVPLRSPCIVLQPTSIAAKLGFDSFSINYKQPIINKGDAHPSMNFPRMALRVLFVSIFCKCKYKFPTCHVMPPPSHQSITSPYHGHHPSFWKSMIDPARRDTSAWVPCLALRNTIPWKPSVDHFIQMCECHGIRRISVRAQHYTYWLVRSIFSQLQTVIP